MCAGRYVDKCMVKHCNTPEKENDDVCEHCSTMS